MKKIFRFAIVCAVAGAALLTGCTKDFTSEIDKLQGDLEKLTKKVEGLENDIKAGALITDVKPFTDGNGGIEVVLSNGKSYKINNGAKGADGKDADVWEIKKVGNDYYWFKNGKQTEFKAKGEDGAAGAAGPAGPAGPTGETGATGNYWKPDVENNKWVEYTSKDEATGKTIEPIFKDGGAMTAVWNAEEGTLEFANVKDAPEGKLKFDLNTQLKSLAFVPARIFDGLGLITVWEVYAPKVGKTFPFIDRKSEGTFLCTAPTEVTYRLNPQNVDPAKYDWSFINRKVYTKATADDNDLVTIVTGPVKDGKLYDFTIKLNKAVEAADHDKINDIVALKAVAKDPSTVDKEFENIVSDYSYIEKDVNKTFYIIHKDEYKADDPKYYRYEEFVKIDDPTDYNANAGIPTPAPGSGTNPKSIALPYDGTIDLADYLETYAFEKKDLASTVGITPEYYITFAGLKDGTGPDVVINDDPDKALYLAADVDKTNQNKFLKIDGTKISVNDAFVSLLSPAIGRTPLLYVQAKYNGKPLAECLIKIEITAEPAPDTPTKGWDVFIWHDAKFKFDDLATPTFTGYEGTASAPRLGITEADKDLNVTWDEVNPWVLNDVDVNMSYEDFGDKYDLANPQLILAKGSKEPGEELPAYEEAVLVSLGDINTYYSKSGTGLTLTSQSPTNWKQSTNIADLKIDNTFVELNKKDVHYVYVLYPAKDNTKNIDVVFKFSFKMDPHQHDWTILKKYNETNYWILNPDYILGTQDELNEAYPGITFDAKPYDVYGAVRIKGMGTEDKSAFIEHFKEYSVVVNEESTYTFRIMNFAQEENVDIQVNGVGTKGTDTGADIDADLGHTAASSKEYTAPKDAYKYAYVTISGADLKKIVNQEAGYVSPDIILTGGAKFSQGYDILVEVTEECAGGFVDPIKGYYYVVFEALKATVKFNKIELGTFKQCNDFALAHEIIEGVYDQYDKKIIEWDEATSAWKLTDDGKAYGLVDADIPKLTFEITKLNYDKNANDTEESFGGRLNAFADATTADPVAGLSAEYCLDWWNMGTDLMVDKVAGFLLEIKLTNPSDPTAEPVVIASGEGDVTVLHTGGKQYPYHIAEGADKGKFDTAHFNADLTPKSE